ncbi:MAG: DUF3617 domain-containing protein [Rudaea sp.]
MLPRPSPLVPRPWILALLALLAFPALAAQDFPKLKPGLWEMEQSSDRTGPPGGPGQAHRTLMCLDAGVQREMFDMGVGAMKGMCSKHDFRFSGNRGTGEFVCDMGGSKMHSKSRMVMNGDSAYRTEVDTTYDPPFMGRAASKMVITARNVGPCKPGQRPGDVVLPNGRTMNLRDAMNGANGMAPPPRPR